MKGFFIALIAIALTWCVFIGVDEYGNEIPFYTETAIHETENIALEDPLSLLDSIGSNVVYDLKNMINGFTLIGNAENPLEWLVAFGAALKNFFVNFAYLFVDLFLAPFQVIMKLIVTVYNILSAWFGLPYWDIRVLTFNRF